MVEIILENEEEKEVIRGFGFSFGGRKGILKSPKK